jgi:hypothetical protein
MNEVGRRRDWRSIGIGLDHRGEVVARFKEGRDDVGVDRQGVGTDALENRFDPMSELGDLGKPDHRRRTLDAMGGPKRSVEVRAIVLAALELDQPLFQADEKLARFLVEHHPKAIVTRQVNALKLRLDHRADVSLFRENRS